MWLHSSDRLAKQAKARCEAPLPIDPNRGSADLAGKAGLPHQRPGDAESIPLNAHDRLDRARTLTQQIDPTFQSEFHS
jgi:hypothetical protein